MKQNHINVFELQKVRYIDPETKGCYFEDSISKRIYVKKTFEFQISLHQICSLGFDWL